MQRLRRTSAMTLPAAVLVLSGLVPTQAAAGICADLALPAPCIFKEDIAERQIRGAFHTANKSIRGAQLGTGAVVQRVIKANAVTGGKVQDGSLRAVDLFDEAGVEFAEGAEVVSLDPGGTIVRLITLTHPTGGFVLASATGSSNFNNVPGGMRCSITTGTAVDSSNRIVLQSPGNLSLIPFGLQRAFTVVGTASTIFRLVCDELSGNVQVDGSNLFAIFVPTRY